MTLLANVANETIRFVPAVTTIAIFILTWVGTFLWNSAKLKTVVEQMKVREEERQVVFEQRHIKICEEIKRLEDWGHNAVAERTAANAELYLRKDVFDARHSEMERNIAELAALKLPATLARIEANQTQLMKDMTTLQISVQQLLERH